MRYKRRNGLFRARLVIWLLLVLTLLPPQAALAAGEAARDAILFDPDPTGELMGTLSPYYEDAQWGLEMIGADAAYRAGFLGQGVRVGVLDSGVNAHPDLSGRLLQGRCFVPEAADAADTSDSYGHGTRVAGLISAASEDAYLGVAPAAEIVPLKVTDGKNVKISALCAAIRAAIDEYGCKVLNLSMGVRTDFAELREAVAYAEEKNVVVVAAVGNDGGAGIYYPAGYDTVIGVGAVDSSGALYYHSNYNTSVFLTAPGVGVRSTAAPGGYVLSNGTSFAAPMVSGAAAVLLSMNPDLTPKEIRALFAATAGDAGAPGYDEAYGYGVLNLAGCVTAGAESAPAAGEPCAFLPEYGPATAVRNNTDAEISCTYLLAVYDASGVCSEVRSVGLTLPPGGTVMVPAPEEGAYFGQFLHDGRTLSPLAAARKSFGNNAS